MLQSLRLADFDACRRHGDRPLSVAELMVRLGRRSDDVRSSLEVLLASDPEMGLQSCFGTFDPTQLDQYRSQRKEWLPTQEFISEFLRRAPVFCDGHKRHAEILDKAPVEIPY